MAVRVSKLFTSVVDLPVTAEGSDRQNAADHCLEVEKLDLDMF
jgi:hypothetical protein